MRFGSVDFNDKIDWSKWKFEDFKKLVESQKGIKSTELIRAFINKVKSIEVIS